MQNARKRCSKCGKVKNTKKFSKNKNRIDGFEYYCKKCSGNRVKKYRQKMVNRSDSEICIPSYKKCSECGVVKLSKEFYKIKQNKDGLRSCCKMCANKKNKIYRDKMISRSGVEIPTVKEKECSKCGKVKPSGEFLVRKTINDGCSGVCRKCSNSNLREYYKNMVSRVDSDIVIPLHKKCPKCGKVKRSKEFYKCRANKDGLNVHCQKCVYERDEKYKKENDLHYRILTNMRSSLRRVLKNQNTKKFNRTMCMVGCSIGGFIEYLESKMISGMTWDNYGGKDGWQIDHIKPCASFDLTDPEQQKECFHYTNLQPLWAEDNLKKNSFYNGKFIRGIRNHG